MAETDPSGGGGGSSSSSSSHSTGGDAQDAVRATPAGPAGAAPPSASPPAPAPREPPGDSPEEYECRICYQLFDLDRRAPKLLECLHTFCLQCLRQLQHRAARSPRRRGGPQEQDEASSGPSALDAIRCPLCRHLTALPGGGAHGLPLNTKRVEAILLQLQGWAPLLRERPPPSSAAPPQRLLLQLPSPARQRPLPPQASPSRGSPDSSGEELRCLSGRKKAGCACALFSVLGMLLLGLAWMEWLTGSVFLAVALALLFFSTTPFVMYRIRFRRQPGTVFLPSLAASGSREASPGRLTPRSRPTASGGTSPRPSDWASGGT